MVVEKAKIPRVSRDDSRAFKKDKLSSKQCHERNECKHIENNPKFDVGQRKIISQ